MIPAGVERDKVIAEGMSESLKSKLKTLFIRAKKEKYLTPVLEEAMKLMQDREWIPVSERLPERVDVVLAYDNELEVNVFAYYFHPDKQWCDMNARGDKLKVTHWQPLPPAPTEDKG